MFLFSGGFKLSGAPLAIENFHRWGYPDWFRVVIGVIETGAALLLLVPKTMRASAGVLAVTMVGATATHLHAGEARSVALPLLLLGLLTLLLLAGRPRRQQARDA